MCAHIILLINLLFLPSKFVKIYEYYKQHAQIYKKAVITQSIELEAHIYIADFSVKYLLLLREKCLTWKQRIIQAKWISFIYHNFLSSPPQPLLPTLPATINHHHHPYGFLFLHISNTTNNRISFPCSGKGLIYIFNIQIVKL